MSKPTSFELWLEAVDRWVMQLCGMNRDDLMDVDYYEMFANHRSPREAARKAIRYSAEG
jgi:hypothetical protein